MPRMRGQLPAWDLSDLYAGADDPRLAADLDALLADAAAFEAAHRGTLAVDDLAAADLAAALDAYEAFQRRAFKPVAFAQLLYHTDSRDARRGALLQRAREFGSAVNAHLVFFELELGRIPADAFARVAADARLAPYRHHLERVRAQAAHHLSEPEERVLVETANARGPAFGRLFTEVHARTRYSLAHDGQVQTLNQSQLLALLRDPDRTRRAAAAAALTAGLQAGAHLGTFIYNTLIHEKAVLDRLRGFDSPEAERHLQNEIPRAVVDACVETCAANYGLVAEYYALKRRLLGLKRLTHVDRYAPLGAARAAVTFEDARRLVLAAFEGFSPRLAELAEPFFARGWIDAAPTDGKSAGAFCAGVTPDLHPFVLLNFTNTPGDVMTLAHELGHGVHNVLAAGNHMLDFHPALPLAETASTFAEMLVFDRLLGDLERAEDRLALLCQKLEDTFATVFRQVALFRFERDAHRARRERGELPTEAFNALWQSAQQAMFGDALTLGPDHAWWWLYIPHIFQQPFYVYAYAFGELLVWSLYAQYRREGAAFVERYFALLSAGGAQPPARLIGGLGVDVADPAFWQRGCDLIAQQVAQAAEWAAALDV